MSYDLYLFRLAPGQAAKDQIRAVMLAEEAEDPGPIDPAAENLKSEIAQALTAAWPWMKPFAFEYPEVARELGVSETEARRRFRHVELNDEREPSRGIQLTINDIHITINLPYWHEGPAAQEVLTEVDAMCAMLGQRWGFVTYDPQLDRVVETGSLLARASPRYQRVVDAMPDILQKAAAKVKRPWWKFW
jgi:hypothetical protein